MFVRPRLSAKYTVVFPLNSHRPLEYESIFSSLPGVVSIAAIPSRIRRVKDVTVSVSYSGKIQTNHLAAVGASRKGWGAAYERGGLVLEAKNHIREIARGREKERSVQQCLAIWPCGDGGWRIPTPNRRIFLRKPKLERARFCHLTASLFDGLLVAV